MIMDSKTKAQGNLLQAHLHDVYNPHIHTDIPNHKGRQTYPSYLTPPLTCSFSSLTLGCICLLECCEDWQVGSTTSSFVLFPAVLQQGIGALTSTYLLKISPKCQWALTSTYHLKTSPKCQWPVVPDIFRANQWDLMTEMENASSRVRKTILGKIHGGGNLPTQAEANLLHHHI